MIAGVCNYYKQFSTKISDTKQWIFFFKEEKNEKGIFIATIKALCQMFYSNSPGVERCIIDNHHHHHHVRTEKIKDNKSQRTSCCIIIIYAISCDEYKIAMIS